MHIPNSNLGKESDHREFLMSSQSFKRRPRFVIPSKLSGTNAVRFVIRGEADTDHHAYYAALCFLTGILMKSWPRSESAIWAIGLIFVYCVLSDLCSAEQVEIDGNERLISLTLSTLWLPSVTEQVSFAEGALCICPVSTKVPGKLLGKEYRWVGWAFMVRGDVRPWIALCASNSKEEVNEYVRQLPEAVQKSVVVEEVMKRFS